MAVAFDFDAVLVPVAPRQCDVTVARAVSMRPFGTPRSSAAVSLNCLVVTGDASLRRRLDAAAALGGWSTIAAPAAVATLAAARRQAHQLVVIDLVSPLGGDRTAVESLTLEFASRPDTLMVVCGGESSGSDEAWSRAQGRFHPHSRCFVGGFARVGVHRGPPGFGAAAPLPSRGVKSVRRPPWACVVKCLSISIPARPRIRGRLTKDPLVNATTMTNCCEEIGGGMH